MLKHTDSESNSTPAERVRVTPEELVAAVAELQAHKEGQSGTIAIGDAVHELSLEESPADILRTIEAQRAQQVQKRKKRRRSWIGATAAVVLMLVPASVMLHSPHVHHVIQTPTLSAAPAETLSLNMVPDEQRVYADPPALARIFQNAPASEIIVHRSQAPLYWGLIKHHGTWYLQGVTIPTTERKLKNGTVSLYSDIPIGYFAVEENGQINYNYITLPITGMHYEDSQMTEHAAGITVSHVHPDSHLWETKLEE